jgi:hypothetical protein
MPSVVMSIPPGEIVDTDVRLTPLVLTAIRAAGFGGVARYVPHLGNAGTNDINAAELEAILASGLGLLLVQHVRSPPWDPRQYSGGADAQVAVQFAKQAGYRPGAHIFLDLEGIVPGTGPATKVFAEAWAAVVVGAQYSAGCYVGYDVPLDAQELYDLHSINSYWSDVGPRQVAVRGFALKQQAAIQIAGIQFDPDTVRPDSKGETPSWMVSAPENVA